MPAMGDTRSKAMHISCARRSKRASRGAEAGGRAAQSGCRSAKPAPATEATTCERASAGVLGHSRVGQVQSLRERPGEKNDSGLDVA